ncbi:hypothetical protein EJB05_40945, partial [Eragrostis curvula]
MSDSIEFDSIRQKQEAEKGTGTITSDNKKQRRAPGQQQAAAPTPSANTTSSTGVGGQGRGGVRLRPGADGLVPVLEGPASDGLLRPGFNFRVLERRANLSSDSSIPFEYCYSLRSYLDLTDTIACLDKQFLLVTASRSSRTTSVLTSSAVSSLISELHDRAQSRLRQGQISAGMARIPL